MMSKQNKYKWLPFCYNFNIYILFLPHINKKINKTKELQRLYVQLLYFVVCVICCCCCFFFFKKKKSHATIPFNNFSLMVKIIKCEITDCRANTKNFKKFVRFQYFPLHSPLLKESWLVFVFALRWLICLNLARILAWVDG